MAYQKQIWYDLPDETTPLNANRLNHIEDGIVGVESLINSLVPIGTILEFAGTSAPQGWMICDGSLLNKSDYAALYSAIGTSYNEDGDASTKFRIPNMQGRVGVGVDNEDTDLNAVGKGGGEKTHTLTINEIPSHRHIANPNGYATSLNQANVMQMVVSGNYGSSAPFLNTDYTGGGQAHNVMQPYLVVNYIIRVS